MLEQQPDDVSDQVAHGDVARDQQQERVAHDLLLADLALAGGGRHHAEEVVALGGAPLGEQVAHVGRHLVPVDRTVLAEPRQVVEGVEELLRVVEEEVGDRIGDPWLRPSRSARRRAICRTRAPV
jgi:hypothetical protein